jgi:EmrB/QacA subfamily drug resistance transporter
MAGNSSRGKAQAQAIADAGGVMTHRQIMFVIFGLMGGMFLGALDQTIVGTSMRTIADDLKGLDQQAWVTTAYLITSTIATPIYGKLSDIFGRRPLFIAGIAIFLAGSLLATISTSMYELAAFRAIQGIGAGGLMSLPLAIMGDILAPRERAKYQGYFLSVFGISSVVGPLIGGLFAGADQILFVTGWRWVFLINLPIGAIALFVVLRFLHIPHSRRAGVRIDWWGAAAVIVALVPLLMVAEQGREWGWGSVGAITCYIVGGLGIVAFVFAERMMGDNALIPLKLFTNATFSMSTILGIIVGFGMFGAMLTIPLYLQLVQGFSPTISGVLMIPIVIGIMTASIVSGRMIAKTGRYTIFPRTGTAVMAVAFFLLTFLRVDTPLWYLLVTMFLVGLGLGQLMQTLTIAAQNSVGPRDIGVATSSSTFFRQIGGTLGVAVIFSVVFSTVGSYIADAFAKSSIKNAVAAALQDPKVLADPDNSAILGIYKSIQAGGSGAAGGDLSDTSFLNNADSRLSAPFLEGFNQSFVIAYWVCLAVIGVAFVLSFFLKAEPLREKSALQENADLEAREAADAMGALVEPGVTTGTIETRPETSAKPRP